jgi:GTP pyrophosphokinase
VELTRTDIMKTSQKKPDHEAMFKEIVDEILEYSPDADIALVQKAFDFALEKHSGQIRRSGEAYIIHPLEVAKVLARLRLDIETIASGILHDTIEDTDATTEELAEEFTPEVAHLVEGVTKIGKLTFRSQIEKQAENFRKMVIAMAKDIRVLLIKLADRAHNIRTLEHLDPKRQHRIASETLEIYAPLAHRMGIHWLKAELEDWSFRFLHTESYYRLVDKVAKTKAERSKFRELVSGEIQKNLKKFNIKAEVTGRPKHFYSIYAKMESNKIEFEQVYDIMAFRIITENVQECYEALGLMHSLWTPIPGRFKDYIAMPKANFYQSLHTTVIGPLGERIEVQIRTKVMHSIAERGIAAHWKYKGGYLKRTAKDDKKFLWLSQLIENHQHVSDPKEFLQSVKLDLFTENIYVFTPKGEVKELPVGSTPVDFAFHIHTQVGFNCYGAKVNGKLVPLKHRLRSGDTIEIVTSKTSVPTKDWLSFVKTSKARTKIKQTIVKEERDKSREYGQQVCEHAFKKNKLNLKNLIKSGELQDVAQSMKIKDVDDLYLQVGYGKVDPNDIIAKLLNKETDDNKKEDLENFIQKFTPADNAGDVVSIAGIPNILIKFAKCCNPLPGENIIGFITRGRGVTIHTEDCSKILDSDIERQVEANWNVAESKDTTVKIRVLCIDISGILNDITKIIASNEVNICSLNIETTKDKKAICDFSLKTYSITHLNKVITGIEKINGIISVKRLKS